jgi:hypothetical protein
LPHDLGVHDGAAVSDTPKGIEKLLDPTDSVFEEVTDARTIPGLEKLGGVSALNVLAEDEHRQRRPLLAQRDRRTQSFVGETWGHPDIRDYDVRFMGDDRRAHSCGITDSSDHLMSEPAEQAGEAFAQ